jgi:hypothetical protein
MNAWKFSLAAVALCLLAKSLLAEDIITFRYRERDHTPSAVECHRACYCPKPLPCPSYPPTVGLRACYCPKPLPCVSCPPTVGLRACYCKKPLPCPTCPPPCGYGGN